MRFEPPLPTYEELALMEKFFKTNLEAARKSGNKERIKKAMMDYVIFKVLLSTGRRLGEILNVRVKDVNLEEGIMWTIIEKSQRKKELHAWPYEKRVIGFPPSVGKLLKEYIEFAELQPHEKLFPVSARYVQYRFEAARKSMGIKKRIVPHSLRVFVITELINKGWSLERIRRITGHKSLGVILKYDRGTYFREKDEYEKVIGNAIEEIEKMSSH